MTRPNPSTAPHASLSEQVQQLQRELRLTRQAHCERFSVLENALTQALDELHVIAIQNGNIQSARRVRLIRI